MNQPFEMFFLVAVITIAVFWRDSEASAGLQNISASATTALEAGANAAAIIDAADKFRRPKQRPKSSQRVRRSPNSGSSGSSGKVVDAIEYFLLHPLVNAVGEGVHKLLPTLIPGNWGDIAVPAVRTDRLLLSHTIFSTLTRSLDTSFKDIIAKYAPDTGDIISCRMTGSSSFGEHYMMMINETMIIEVGTPSGTKFKNSGSVQIIRINASNYYESKECLFHRNSILGIAVLCDELNEKKVKAHQRRYVEYNQKMGEIMKRVRAMMTGKELKGFDYRTLSCNCQDLVLYWAYGYVNNRDCISQLFPDASIVQEHSLDDLKSYFDSHEQKCRTDTDSYLAAVIGGV